MIPQLMLLATWMIGAGIHLARHGEPRPKDLKYNAWYFSVSKAILWTILYYGGFWDGILLLLNN